MFAERTRFRSYLRRKIKFESMSVEEGLSKLLITRGDIEAVDRNSRLFRITADFKISTDVNIKFQPPLELFKDYYPIFYYRPAEKTPIEEIEVLFENIPVLEMYIYDERQDHGSDQVIKVK
jgi:hypothetical protein